MFYFRCKISLYAPQLQQDIIDIFSNFTRQIPMCNGFTRFLHTHFKTCEFSNLKTQRKPLCCSFTDLHTTAFNGLISD